MLYAGTAPLLLKTAVNDDIDDVDGVRVSGPVRTSALTVTAAPYLNLRVRDTARGVQTVEGLPKRRRTGVSSGSARVSEARRLKVYRNDEWVAVPARYRARDGRWAGVHVRVWNGTDWS
jgi:hypothetical protein